MELACEIKQQKKTKKKRPKDAGDTSHLASISWFAKVGESDQRDMLADNVVSLP